MEKTLSFTESSDLFARINLSGLSAGDRMEAIGALRGALELMTVVEFLLKLKGKTPRGVPTSAALKAQ